MSIHIILGKPGSGKSLYATKCLIQQLRDTRRNVVTNLPLKLPELNTYLQSQYPTENLEAISRVRLLDEEQLKSFWLFRGVSDEDKGEHGVAYFLDEAHICFNARDWAQLGRAAIHYMSQHRKLGDVVFPITQAVGNLDKQFRSVAEDYTVLKNESVIKMGPFRGAARFKRRSYYSEPQPNSEPFETATFVLDAKGVANCYDTARGIGVHGSKADIGRRANGISIYWVFPIVIATALATIGIPMWLGRAASNFVQGTKKPIEQLTQKQSTGSSPAREGDKGGRPLSAAQGQDEGQRPEPIHVKNVKDGKPFPTGYAVRRGRVTVVMSDGEIITEQDKRVASGGRGRVVIDGQTETLRPNPLAKSMPIKEEKLIGTNPEPPTEVPPAELSQKKNEDSSKKDLTRRYEPVGWVRYEKPRPKIIQR